MSYRKPRFRCECCGQALPLSGPRAPQYWIHFDDAGNIDAVRRTFFWLSYHTEWYDGWVECTTGNWYTEELRKLERGQVDRLIGDDWTVVKCAGVTLDDEWFYHQQAYNDE